MPQDRVRDSARHGASAVRRQRADHAVDSAPAGPHRRRFRLPPTVRLPAAMSLRRLKFAPLLVVLALLAAGCGGTREAHPGTPVRGLTGHEVADSDNDGSYIEAGNITYQLQVSRAMNPWGVEDSQYMKGLPAGLSARHLPPDELWYGVFLWAKNQHHRALMTPGADHFEIADTLGHIYRPVDLNSNLNPYAWNSEQLQFNETEPGQDSTAANGFIGGRLLLFKVNNTIYANRPLTLYVLSNSGQRIGEISLDL